MANYSTYKAEDLVLDESFIRYCLGDADSVIFWEDFLQQHPEMQAEIEHAQNLYTIIAVRVPLKDRQTALHSLQQAIAAGPTAPVLNQQEASVYSMAVYTGRRRNRLVKLFAAAVSIGIIVAAAWLFNQKSVFNIGKTPIAAFAKAKYIQIIQSEVNPRKEITLPDGSIVTLNYGSTIKMEEDYNRQHRWVYLEGEAFFSVKPDKKRPFVVITSRNATSALGTSFKVRDYTGEAESDVMLATGKVKVQSMLTNSSKGDLILVPGESATSTQNKTLEKSSFDLSLLDNWRSPTIELNKANLDKIIQTLEFNYGVQVRLQNKPVKEVAFTGKFDKKSLQDVLEAISFTNKFSYTQKGNIVSILFQ